MLKYTSEIVWNALHACSVVVPALTQDNARAVLMDSSKFRLPARSGFSLVYVPSVCVETLIISLKLYTQPERVIDEFNDSVNDAFKDRSVFFNRTCSSWKIKTFLLVIFPHHFVQFFVIVRPAPRILHQRHY